MSLLCLHSCTETIHIFTPTITQIFKKLKRLKLRFRCGGATKFPLLIQCSVFLNWGVMIPYFSDNQTYDSCSIIHWAESPVCGTFLILKSEFLPFPPLPNLFYILLIKPTEAANSLWVPFDLFPFFLM